MCDSVVAVGSETAAGSTLFAKNSDRARGECQPFVQHSEASHPEGSKAPCTHLEIPQVAETYRVMGHSPWWVWGFEHGVNEHAVAIGNHTVFSNDPIEAGPGLIGMDLVRLGLERGRDAREALEVIAGLIEKYGQGGSALAPGSAAYHNSFLLADPAEAWLLETSNRHWAARRQRLAGVSNHLSIRADWEIGSKEVESFARAQGWWRVGGRVDVAAAFGNPHIPAHLTSGRRRRSAELLREGSGAHDVSSFQRVLRDHGANGAPWRPGGTPEDEGYFTLCAHSEPVQWTTASLVTSLPDDRTGPWPVWISFGTPCSGIFLPVYLDGALPSALARGGECDEPDSVWWAFERLRSAAQADPERHTEALRTGWEPLERAIETERPGVELAARAASLEADRDHAAAIVTEFMDRCVARTLECADALAARLR